MEIPKHEFPSAREAMRAQAGVYAHLAGTPEAIQQQIDAATVSEDEIEVKYIPNRAQRRAAEQARRRSVRRGQRAADRRVRELEAGMSPEEIARARALAAKQLGGRRG